MIKKINVGIDIGGTKVNIGLVDDKGIILDSIKLSSFSNSNPEQLISVICTNTLELIRKNNLEFSDINSFGVGVPGTVDYKTGFVEYCPNLKWHEVDAGNIFQKYLGTKPSVSQDSRLAAWAEFLVGAGKSFQSFICITIGTGIGAGIVIDGKIYHGAMNTAGELGHTIFSKNGRKCNCGNSGCFERYTSGTAVLERALEKFPEKIKGLPQKSETVFELANRGDVDAINLLKDIVEDLAVGIANVVSILSPEAILLSGGLSEHEKLVIEPLKELVFKFGYFSWSNKKELKILRAKLGSEAPMIGAALYYKFILNGG